MAVEGERWCRRPCPHYAVVLAMGATAAAALPQVQVDWSAHVWKRDVVMGEPILVRIEARNDGDATAEVVGPFAYTFTVTQATPPLTARVLGAAGDDVAGPPGRPGGLPWRVRGPGALAVPIHTWVIPPGETASMWFDLLGLVTLDVEGTFRVVLDYQATPEIVARLTKSSPDAEVWLGSQTIDAGEVTIRRPTGDDEAAFDIIRQYRDREFEPVVMSHSEAFFVRLPIIEEHPDSVYAPYARFYELYRNAAMGDAAASLAQVDGEVQRFTTDYPDFPLNYRWPPALALQRFEAVAAACSRAGDALERARRHPDQGGRVPGAAELRDLAAAVREAADAAVAAAEATGDYDIEQFARTTMWFRREFLDYPPEGWGKRHEGD
jgi:hypothetical protein